MLLSHIAALVVNNQKMTKMKPLRKLQFLLERLWLRENDLVVYWICIWLRQDNDENAGYSYQDTDQQIPQFVRSGGSVLIVVNL